MEVELAVALAVRLAVADGEGEVEAVELAVTLPPRGAVELAVTPARVGVIETAGAGVHQNQPATAVPPALRSTTTGGRPRSSSMSSRILGSTGWNSSHGQGR